MKFYWGFKYKSPSKRRRDKLRKEKFLAKFRRAPVLGQSPSWSLVNPLPVPSWVDLFQKPSSLPSPQRWRSWWLKSRRCIRMCNWVLDLKDQKYDVQKEIWKLEQDLHGKREEQAQLEARKKSWKLLV